MGVPLNNWKFQKSEVKFLEEKFSIFSVNRKAVSSNLIFLAPEIMEVGLFNFTLLQNKIKFKVEFHFVCNSLKKNS